MTITKVNCPINKIDMKCPYTKTPEMIVIHNTAGSSSAMSEISYMLGNDRYVSFHYAVDNERVVQGIDENRCAWHAGNYPINLKSIGIEICYSLNGGDIFGTSENNTVELVVDILKRYGWGIDRVRYHKEFTNTNCPHRTLELGWERFLNKVREKLNGSTPTPITLVQPISKYSPGSYQINSSIGLKVRSTPSTDYAKVGFLTNGSKQGIDRVEGNWGHLMNNAGWICLDYCFRLPDSQPNPVSNGYSLGRYKVNSSIGLNVRPAPNTNNTPIKTYPNGTVFDTYQISGNWAKTPSGWVCLDYTTLIYKY